ncbi:MAG: SIS domain-containing protein, partial [Proteobacteria bacterium]|nr:SIS domain-containing protein [Pseudomonadota bacterium]
EKGILQLKRDIYFQDIFFRPEKAGKLSDLAREMKLFLLHEENLLEENAPIFSTEELETISGRLIQMKDVCWSLEKDILDNIEKIVALSGVGETKEVSPEGFRKYVKINFLLNSLDRLEIRGRDSAGIQVSFTLGDNVSPEKILKTLKENELYEDFIRRMNGGDLLNGSIHSNDGHFLKKGAALSFTYKTASIIGKLGRNVRELRRAISSDRIFHLFANEESGFETSLAHTRWASVGSITEDNCHPINNFTLSSPQDNRQTIKSYPHYGEGNWSINVVLNGDIDNYQTLRNSLESEENLLIAPELTSDTKIIPLQIEKYLLKGHDLSEAFRLAAGDFKGSHAIAMESNLEPGKAHLALKGSGQSIYIGLCEDKYVFSSELYGLVEETPFFLKMAGENNNGESETEGQIFILDQDSPGGLSEIKALHYDGTPLQITEDSIQKAEITTRDIDRGNYPHYFLKEITESAISVRKTLRGKYRISEKSNGRKEVVFNLGENILPEKLRKSLTRDEIRHIIIIGQGTAAVAGTAIADGLTRYLKGTRIKIESKAASEFSGFSLEDNLRDTLVVAITQSGTTTDTNRAVAMASERGAAIIAIVNRRQSDITSMADGVFYTSDGRDIEMSVASTKAFYSQIIAGHIMALGFAQLLKTVSDDFIAGELTGLEQASDMMKSVMGKREKIEETARRFARQKKYWAVVGSGPNKAAADEIRIKLSELCYKTISSDIVEDKKHIDLSAEPLIIVCAAGNPGNVTEDIVKDVAIFKAHKAGVIVFADEGEDRFNEIADSVITVPGASMPLPVILNTVAGHLWGYYAASIIDEDASFIREFRSKLSLKTVEEDRKHYSIYEKIADKNLHMILEEFSTKFNKRRSGGSLSLMNVRTVSDIALLLKYAAGKLPLEDFTSDFEDGNGASPIDLLDISLGHAIDELSRPIDAIRHQAKTVTVGTSRKEELRGILFDFLAELGFAAKNLPSKDVPVIKRIQKAISLVKGYTLYDINNLDAEGKPQDTSTIAINRRGGISLQMKSRAEASSTLMGTKKTIVRTGEVYVGLGKSDGASIVTMPLLKERSGVKNLLLIHTEFNESLVPDERKESLGDRYYDIRNLIDEYNLPWDDSYLERIPMGILLGEAPEVIAAEIKKFLE